MADKAGSSIRRTAFRAGAVYYLCALIWIMATDYILGSFIRDPVVLTYFQMVKGNIFILATGILFFYFMYGSLKNLDDIRRARDGERAERLKILEQREHYLSVSTSVVYALGYSGGEFLPAWVSDNLKSVLGYSPREALEPGWWNRNVHPDDLQTAVSIQDGISGKDILTREYRFRKSGGDFVWIYDRQKPVYDEAGVLKEVVGSWTDITEKKAAEEKLMEAVRIKSDFVSGVSHELRTPLAAIKESVGVVSEGLLGEINPGQKDMLESADRNISRLSKLVKEVLDFQGLESGRMRMDFVEGDFNGAVEDAVGMLKRQAEAKGLDFLVDLDGNIPSFKFDRDRMIQALLNLIDNAIKFTDEGRVEVRTRLDGDYVEAAVLDTGRGLSRVSCDRIFAMFEQAEDAGSGKPHGFGIGLPITERIITRHGGDIWAGPRESGGSAFKFRIPLS